MAPKQHMGKEVATSVTAPPPPPTIECPIMGMGSSSFFSEFFFIYFEAKFWLFHGKSTAIHHDLVISESQTPLILILLNFKGFSSPLIS